MGLTTGNHRPLVAGIRIRSGKKVGNRLQSIEGGGTLTGLAIRVVNGVVQKMLLTRQQVKDSPHVGFDLGLTPRERVYYYAL